jgi:hypothetical protein
VPPTFKEQIYWAKKQGVADAGGGQRRVDGDSIAPDGGRPGRAFVRNVRGFSLQAVCEWMRTVPRERPARNKPKLQT